jgi:hypothetical protein
MQQPRKARGGCCSPRHIRGGSLKAVILSQSASTRQVTVLGARCCLQSGVCVRIMSQYADVSPVGSSVFPVRAMMYNGVECVKSKSTVFSANGVFRVVQNQPNAQAGLEVMQAARPIGDRRDIASYSTAGFKCTDSAASRVLSSALSYFQHSFLE